MTIGGSGRLVRRKGGVRERDGVATGPGREAGAAASRGANANVPSVTTASSIPGANR